MIDQWFKNDLRSIFDHHSVTVLIDESGDAEFLLKVVEDIRLNYEWSLLAAPHPKFRQQVCS